MHFFNDYNHDDKMSIVQIMRADFNTTQSKQAWLQAAEQLNPSIIGPTSGVLWETVLAVAQRVGETVVK